jgi:DNA repair protein RecO (recombination protein O)
MAILKSEAIPVRISDYSETSIVADFFSRQYGLVRALCKGARRKAKAYESAIDLLTLGELTYYERSSGLNILKQFSVTSEHQPLRRDISRYRAALACLDLVRQAGVENQPAPGLFDLFCDALEACSSGKKPWSGVCSFLLGGLSKSGFAPSLDACASCGSTSFPHGPKARTAVSLGEGGLLCMNCGQGKKVEMWLTHEALSLLKWLSGVKPCKAAERRLEPAVARDVGAFLKRYCEFTFERPFRMLKY